MVTWTGAKTYRDTQIVTKYVSEHALRKRVLNVGLSERRIPAATKSSKRPGTEDDPERIEALHDTLVETMRGLKQQVRLRHSGYYESQEIIEEVARAIAAPDATESAGRASDPQALAS